MTIADGSDVLASDILAIKQNAQTAFDMAQNALSDATDALAAATAALAAAEGAYPATGGVIDGIVTIGAGAKNSLTITPGATATGASDSIVFAQSGKGGFQFGSATTARLFIGPGSTPGSGVQISTDGSTGSLALFATSFLFGFPLISNFISVTLGNGSVPIQFDTIPTGPGIRFSEQIGVGNSASGHNVLTILPGATASAPIIVTQSGTGGLALPAISAPLMELLDPATAIRVGTYLDQNDAFNIGLPASGTTIASRFTINATGTLTADTGNIATAATITSGTPLQVGTITADNTGMTVGQSALLTSPTPVTIGGAFTVIWVTATGFFTATLVVKTSVVSGTTRTIGAVGTVSGSPLTANGITFTAIYSQPGGAGTTISVSYNVVTNYSGAPWLTVGPTAIKIGSGTKNALTITPGAAASNDLTLAASGTGSLVLTANLTVQVNARSFSVGTAAGNAIAFDSGVAVSNAAQIGSTSGAGLIVGGTTPLSFNNKNPPIAKPTGWGAPTGTATRTTFDTATVTLQQLAEHVKALIDNLTSYGLIGP